MAENEIIEIKIENIKILGNKLFKKNELNEAIKIYSKGIKLCQKYNKNNYKIKLLSNRSISYFVRYYLLICLFIYWCVCVFGDVLISLFLFIFLTQNFFLSFNILTYFSISSLTFIYLLSS